MDTPDQEPLPEMATCQECGTTDDVELLDDPYMMEIHNESVPLYYCPACYYARSMDV